MERLRFFNGLTLRAIIWFPLALIYWPLVSWNYHLRYIGEMPDEWYWADEWLIDHGWYVGTEY